MIGDRPDADGWAGRTRTPFLFPAGRPPTLLRGTTTSLARSLARRESVKVLSAAGAAAAVVAGSFPHSLCFSSVCVKNRKAARSFFHQPSNAYQILTGNEISARPSGGSPSVINGRGALSSGFTCLSLSLSRLLRCSCLLSLPFWNELTAAAAAVELSGREQRGSKCVVRYAPPGGRPRRGNEGYAISSTARRRRRVTRTRERQEGLNTPSN